MLGYKFENLLIKAFDVEIANVQNDIAGEGFGNLQGEPRVIACMGIGIAKRSILQGECRLTCNCLFPCKIATAQIQNSLKEMLGAGDLLPRLRPSENPVLFVGQCMAQHETR